MYKKISLLCILSFLVSMMNFNVLSFAATDKFNNESSVLCALGLDDADMKGKATNDYFLSALSGFLYEPEYKIDPEEYARNTGIIEYGETYQGDYIITVNDALRYAVITLGYKEYAESKGNDGFLNVASSLGILSGVEASGENKISVKDCRHILYNMLEVEPMSATIKGTETVYSIEYDETLLSKYRNIYKIDGLVTANATTSLSNEYGCNEGYIKIDNDEYQIKGWEDDGTLLGKNVEAYIIVDASEDNKVLCLSERYNKNKEMVIDAKDIYSVDSDFSQIKYTVDERLKTVDITNVPKVIYNGVFYSDYEVADFIPEAGNIRLLDNDTDGKYDVIFITSYETVIVSAVDLRNKTIYNKFNIAGHLYSVELEPNTTDVSYTITKNGENMDFSDIKISDILSISVSKSKRKVIEVLVCDEQISGKLDNIDEIEKSITVDGVIYEITDAFLRFKNTEAKKISIGNAYNFYIDSLGNIAYWSVISEDGYAVLYSPYQEEVSSMCYITYMDMNGKWIDAPLADKVYYNKTKYDNYDETLYDTLKGIRGQVIKIKTNSLGKINKIETATESMRVDANSFTKTPYAQYPWRSEPKSFDCKYFLNDGAKLIIIPDDVRAKDAYAVREAAGYFSPNKNYTVSLYDMDDFYFSSLLSIKYTPQVKNTLFVVTKVKDVCVDDEAVSQLVGNTGKYLNFTLTGVNNSIFDNVSIGDVIKVSLNSIGRVDSVEKVFSLDGTFTPTSNPIPYDSKANLAGTVTMIDSSNGKMLVDFGGAKLPFRINEKMSVQRYDKGEDVLEISNINSIVVGDKIFLCLKYGQIEQIYVSK